MASTKQNVHEIIHAASIACAGVGRGSAQAADTDSMAIAQVQTNMILSIASEHGIEITGDAAVDLLKMFKETAQRRQVLSNRQTLVGWLPGIDNVVNDSTVATLTVAIGWAANSHFEQTEAK